MTNKPIYFAVAATTIDGKIAKHPSHFSNWTSKEDKEFLHEILDSADLVLVGNNTYKLAIEPLSKRNCLVITRSVPEVQIVSPLLTYLNPASASANQLVAENGYKRICVLGGTQVYSFCLMNDLLDELYLTIEPVSFGGGLGLFDGSEEAVWQLTSTKQLNDKGSLLLHYRKQKSDH